MSGMRAVPSDAFSEIRIVATTIGTELPHPANGKGHYPSRVVASLRRDQCSANVRTGRQYVADVSVAVVSLGTIPTSCGGLRLSGPCLRSRLAWSPGDLGSGRHDLDPYVLAGWGNWLGYWGERPAGKPAGDGGAGTHPGGPRHFGNGLRSRNSSHGLCGPILPTYFPCPEIAWSGSARLGLRSRIDQMGRRATRWEFRSDANRRRLSPCTVRRFDWGALGLSVIGETAIVLTGGAAIEAGGILGEAAAVAEGAIIVEAGGGLTMVEGGASEASSAGLSSAV